LKITDKIYTLKLGKIIFKGTPEELETGEKLEEIFFV
jgi:ABC-type cobalamin/Fe3+-siderophores transport system ATPase subunit